MKDILKIALEQYGNKEIRGNEHNEEVVKYFTEIGFKQIQDDETAWCSAFINWCAMMAGQVRSDKLDARSWLKIGSKVTHPRMGDIVVFWRDDLNSWKGHVGIYISSDNDTIYCLGGNQSNMVNIAPYSKQKLLGYRRLYPK